MDVLVLVGEQVVPKAMGAGGWGAGDLGSLELEVELELQIDGIC